MAPGRVVREAGLRNCVWLSTCDLSASLVPHLFVPRPSHDGWMRGAREGEREAEAERQEQRRRGNESTT